jgi:hypothetical protein
MKANRVIKLCIIAGALMTSSGQLVAKLVNCNKPVIEFLGEQVVFCDSKGNLNSYIDMADALDMDGLNRLVLAGGCNFVPDGQYLALQEYTNHTISSAAVIAAPIQGLTLWTYKVFVSKGDLDSVQFSSGRGSGLDLEYSRQSGGQGAGPIGGQKMAQCP